MSKQFYLFFVSNEHNIKKNPIGESKCSKMPKEPILQNLTTKISKKNILTQIDRLHFLVVYLAVIKTFLSLKMQIVK